MTAKKRAIRHAFYRLGLHTTPESILAALSQQGVQVTEEIVRQVRFEMVKNRQRKAYKTSQAGALASRVALPQGISTAAGLIMTVEDGVRGLSPGA